MPRARPERGWRCSLHCWRRWALRSAKPSPGWPRTIGTLAESAPGRGLQGVSPLRCWAPIFEQACALSGCLGRTGTGKTGPAGAGIASAAGVGVVDLGGLAITVQAASAARPACPSRAPEHFENRLAARLVGLGGWPAQFWLEAESVQVGSLAIPAGFWRQAGSNRGWSAPPSNERGGGSWRCTGSQNGAALAEARPGSPGGWDRADRLGRRRFAAEDWAALRRCGLLTDVCYDHEAPNKQAMGWRVVDLMTLLCETEAARAVACRRARQWRCLGFSLFAALDGLRFSSCSWRG